MWHKQYLCSQRLDFHTYTPSPSLSMSPSPQKKIAKRALPQRNCLSTILCHFFPPQKSPCQHFWESHNSQKYFFRVDGQAKKALTDWPWGEGWEIRRATSTIFTQSRNVQLSTLQKILESQKNKGPSFFLKAPILIVSRVFFAFSFDLFRWSTRVNVKHNFILPCHIWC